MYRRNIVGISALVVGLAMVPGGAGAQQKSIKDQVVGTWTLLLADNIKDDGTHVSSYGPNPEGLLVFTADGHYSLQIIRYGRPAFASKNRMSRHLHGRRGRQVPHITHCSKLVPELGRDGAKASRYGDHRRSPDLEHAGAVGRRLCAGRGGVEEGKVSASEGRGGGAPKRVVAGFARATWGLPRGQVAWLT